MKQLRFRLRNFLKSARDKSQTDPARDTAFWHMVKFFLLMLLLTLLARGLSGVSVARVELGTPTQQTIVQSIQTTGTVTPRGESVIAVPAGLMVTEIPVQLGEYVPEGAVLVRFDAQELEYTLLRKEAELEQLYVQLDTLLDRHDVSDDAVLAAERDWERACATLEQAESLFSDARNTLVSAEEALTSAQETLAALLEEAETEPEDPSLALAIQQAQTAVSEAETQVQTAKAEKETAEDTLTAAQDTALDAKTRLESAQEDYKEASKQAGRTDRSNAASAELVRLDIAGLREEIEILEKVKSSGYCLTAAQAGEVTQLPLTEETQTTGTERLTIATTGDGYWLTFQIAPEGCEQLLEAMPVLRISQSGLTDTAELSSADRETEPDGSMTFRLLLNSAGWSGQPVNITAEISKNTYSTCVPLSALHQDAGGYFVYVFRTESNLLGITNLAVRVSVSVEDMNTQYAAISGTLGIQDQVIISSNKPLSDGDRVRVEP